MGQPAAAIPQHSVLNKIGMEGDTGGSEPSQYPEEKKATAISSVVANERETAQTAHV